jgi:hypothetical protein
MGEPLPNMIKTISDWHKVLKSDETTFTLPVAPGSGSYASRIRGGDANKSRRLPPEYVAQEAVTRLIDLVFGLWPKDDPAVVRKAVCMIANHMNVDMELVWRMTFEEFHAALADPNVILHKLIGSPPTPLQRHIWHALDGRALTGDELAVEVLDGEKSRLYNIDRKAKTGGLNELMKVGCVRNKRTRGYYRPDSPPATN